MKISAIIPAAGMGKRMKTSVPKLFLELNGKIVFLHTVEKICNCSLIDEIVLVTNEKLKPKISSIIRKESINKVKTITYGGETRGESVLNGLKCISDDSDYVLVHDCARPLIANSVIVKSINKLIQNNSSVDGIVVGVPVKSTIKENYPGKQKVRLTLNRTLLWEIQTPQVFKKEDILYAYENISIKQLKQCKDDSQVLEKFDKDIEIFKGEDTNIKITTIVDLKIAESILTYNDN